MMKIDPFVEAERHIQRGLKRLPPFISRWFGYRGSPSGPSPTYLVCLWGFIGAFCGLGVIFAVFGHTNYFTSRNVPPIVASFGASAILCYGAIDVPLAQPRSLVFGHFFSALTGVILATIFQLDLSDADDVPRLQWLAACLSTSVALVVMHLTKTTHPPAGATALMPCVDPGIWALRWYFLPVVLLSSSLVLASALISNNIQRQYPKFWITPIPPAPPASVKEQNKKHQSGLAETPGNSPESKAEGPSDLESGRLTL